MNFNHWGNKPMPCVTCGHQSRDHNRSTKQKDGSWNGSCLFGGCLCKLYIKPKSMERIEK